MYSLTYFMILTTIIHTQEVHSIDTINVPSESENIKIIKSPCDHHACPVGHICVASRGNPLCICNHYCSKSSTTGSLCSWDGRTFESLCELRTEECRTGKYITVHHYGPCKESRKNILPAREPSHHEAEFIQEVCEDSARESSIGLCKAWKRAGSCEYQKPLMERYCKKTCDYCIPSSEVEDFSSCRGTLYGCCKGSMLAALGPNQEGCLGKGCDDVSMCRFFPQFCGSSANEITMRKYCPFTCRYCIDKERQRKIFNPHKLKK